MAVIKPQNGVRCAADTNGEKREAKWTFAPTGHLEPRLMRMVIGETGCPGLAATETC